MKVLPPKSDMGRWNELIIQGKRGKKLLVITAYRVCKNCAATAGPTTSFSQQWHILRWLHTCNPDPPKQFIHDLEARVSSARREKQGVLITFDANDSLQHFNNDFTQWVRRSGLVDIHVCRHGTNNEPHTHEGQGPHRLHAAFGRSRGLCHCNRNIGSNRQDTYTR
jgi:hypothetical protein